MSEYKHNPKLSEYVLEAIRAGQRIEALKRVREETGLGLKDAKMLIDQEIAINHATNPHYQHAPNQTPLFAVILVVGILTVITCYVVVNLRLKDVPSSPTQEETSFLRSH